MATLYSVQTQSLVSQERGYQNGLRDVNATSRFDFFERNVTDAVNGNIANGDVIILARIPRGARILDGVFTNTAAGASVTGTIGTLGAKTGTASAAALLGSTSLTSAARTPFAQTQALGFGTLTTEETYITLTVGGGTPTGGANFSGYIQYAVN